MGEVFREQDGKCAVYYFEVYGSVQLHTYNIYRLR